jgi:hypothetical protein
VTLVEWPEIMGDAPGDYFAYRVKIAVFVAKSDEARTKVSQNSCEAGAIEKASGMTRTKCGFPIGLAQESHTME